MRRPSTHAVLQTLTLTFLLGGTAPAQTTQRDGVGTDPNGPRGYNPASLGDFLNARAALEKGPISADAEPSTSSVALARNAETETHRERRSPATQSKKPFDRVPTGDRVHGIEHSKMYYATDANGSTWARGAAYKSRFDAAGATYFPAFGKRQPHNVPHVLSPDRVTLAGEPLGFAHDAAATRDGDHVAFDRGSFVESYDLAPQSVEQSFVFSSLPRTGELVLHIPVASELEARESDGGLEFRGENGRVTYGRATAIDASGKRATAETVLEDGAITIHVDASFVAAATMPLVIDPIVNTFVINDATNSNDFYSDAAYDPQSHEWIVAYEEKNSGADSDVFFARLTDQGLVIGGSYVDLSTNSWESVHCANNAQTEMFLIVATVISGVHSSIHGYMFHATSPGITQFVIADESLGSVYFPVVGGDPSIGSGTTYFCVAYTRVFSASDWDILARLVTPNGTLVGTQPIFLSNSSATLDIYPAISKSNDHNEWMIAWQRNNGTNNAADIWGGRIRWDGLVTANPFQITNFAVEERNAAVSSPVHGTLRYCVAWQMAIDTSPTALHDVVAAVFDANTKLSQLDLYFTDAYDLDQLNPSVDCDGSHFLVARSDGLASQYDIVATDLYVFGNTLGISQHALLLDTSAPTTEDNPRVVSAAASGATDASLKHRCLVTWNSGPAGGFADVRGGFVDTLDGGGAEPFCSPDGINLNCPCGSGSPGHGCKNSANAAGALLAATGAASPSNDSLVLHATGLPGNALCIFLQGTQDVGPVLFGDGVRCVGGTLLRLKSVAASAGSVSLPGPGDPPISTLGGVPPSGGTRYYQAWYRDPAMFCVSDTFNISNGLIVTWAP